MTGPARRRFELDVRAERAIGNLRLGGAILVGACAVWIAVSGPSALGWLAAGVAALACLGWVIAWIRGRRRSGGAGEWYLELGEDTLTLAEGPRRLQVPWREVDEVLVDEDRLVVRLQRGTDKPVDIQPRYRNTSLHELGEAIDRAHRDASRSERG